MGLLALAACKKPSPPRGFGVNLTIDSSGVDPAVRSQIAGATLYVTGDDPTPYSTALDVASQLRSGSARFRYDPKVHSGALSMHVDALDGAGAVISSGDAGSITLVDGQAAAADIVLGAALALDMGADVSFDMGPDASPDLFMPKAQGQPCGTDSDCETGYCADGVCCDNACTGACRACNLTGSAGTCSPIAAGAMPGSGHPSCGPDAQSSCGRDGTCDGAGACHLYALGTTCSSPSCDNGTNTFTPASTCDGKGVCVAATSRTCAPYVCQDAQSCYGSCTAPDNSHCSGSNTCANGSCGPKQNGVACAMGAECQSGNCVDSVCCDTACTGTCVYCNLPATPGQCKTVNVAGQDPRHQCAVGSGSNKYCSPGGCDGTNPQCRRAAMGTACAGSCNGATPNESTCDANGTCSITNPATSCVTPCNTCVVGSTSAGCQAVADGSVTCNAGSCSGNIAYKAAKCTGGACPVRTSQNCGVYNCYTTGDTAACYTSCGNCVAISGNSCGVFLCYPNCPQYCSSGHSCGSTCTPDYPGAACGKIYCQ
ncbi:MAG TPA: hypothetical protein VF334_10200 [Polyangia bacterium]